MERFTAGSALRDPERLLREAAEIAGTGERIEFISARFLGVPYRSNTLGSAADGEDLVVNLAEVDCFTLLDYVEAMRHAATTRAFREFLTRIRYRDGVLSFAHRNHFFSDWAIHNRQFVEDATAVVGAGRVRHTTKALNRREDDSLFIPGIIPVLREIAYIPSGLIDADVIERLRTGDYAGMYTDLPGLDVSHVGIIIRREERLLLRHASSVQGRVLDEDFSSYMEEQPGLLLLRPRG